MEENNDSRGTLAAHDAFFKDLITEPGTAGQFFAAHLPAELVAQFVDKPPELVPGSFVDEDLASHHTDILYRVKLRDGGDVYLYTLVEHKSSPDPDVALQLLRYQTRIWSKLVKGGVRRPLPNIIPIVVYHGASKWPYTPHFSAMLAPLPEPQSQFQLDFKYHLIDLSQIPDDELSENPRLASFLLALKYARHSDVETHLRIILTPIEALTDVDFIRLITYIMAVSRETIDGQVLGRVLDHVAPRRKEEIMNSFVKEIYDKGKLEGKLEGMAEGKSWVLLRLLRQRFGDIPPAVEARIRAADSDRLDQWVDRAFSATSLDELFTPPREH